MGQVPMTEEEKARIRAEEIYRAEVRREFESNQAKHSQLWFLLNSSFALWFLSSVVLAGLTTAVTYYQAKRSEHLHKTETERRLDTEISSRIALAVRVVRIEESNGAHGIPTTASAMYGTPLSYLDNSFTPGTDDFSIYPEYKSRTFRSLIFELGSIVDPSERPPLSNAIAGYEKLRDMATAEDEKTKATQQTAETIIDALDKLTLPRWRTLQFAPETRR